MNKSIDFLKELQKELREQDNDCQAAPRFWTVGDYRWVSCSEDNAERYSIYIPDDGESYELQDYLAEEKDNEELSEEAREAFEEIECETSALEWIQEYRHADASMWAEKQEHCIAPSTMFLTKAEAKRHIELNHYHYTKKAHTYAMTAWRAPKVEKLLEILENFNWESIKS